MGGSGRDPTVRPKRAPQARAKATRRPRQRPSGEFGPRALCPRRIALPGKPSSGCLGHLSGTWAVRGPFLQCSGSGGAAFSCRPAARKAGAAYATNPRLGDPHHLHHRSSGRPRHFRSGVLTCHQALRPRRRRRGQDSGSSSGNGGARPNIFGRAFRGCANGGWQMCLTTFNRQNTLLLAVAVKIGRWQSASPVGLTGWVWL